MKKLNPTLFSFAKVYCNIFGHKLRVSKDITNHVHEYQCKKCGMEMTDTADGFLARLSPKFKETNRYLAQIHQKRKRVFVAKAS
ncbi:hypothetical protein GFO_3141 [Christiangramia forsetii KT0803]|uniref:Uncharacterized protein n=2 Tax=Christiangramia forsetii TaxID=411153 RepID=A0M640_CHRFK|nr:hypothetical protein GCM10011532_13700 [Christiangramia forsetii]CAL68085.1 hypothetical protein GFO_3141 [Christiangramia forsetii KT0803]